VEVKKLEREWLNTSRQMRKCNNPDSPNGLAAGGTTVILYAAKTGSKSNV
jgi:hypothetical protein